MNVRDTARRELREQIRSPFAAKLVAAMPEPALLVDSEGRAAAGNQPTCLTAGSGKASVLKQGKNRDTCRKRRTGQGDGGQAFG